MTATTIIPSPLPLLQGEQNAIYPNEYEVNGWTGKMELKDLILCSHVTLSLFAINLSIRLTRLPVYLPCYPFFFTINLFTRLFVHLSTYLVTLSFFTSNSFTCLLVYLSTYYVTLSFSQATCLLVYLFTRQLTLLLCLPLQATCLLVHLSTRRNYSAIIDI